MRLAFIGWAHLLALAVSVILIGPAPSGAEPLRIVAVGASNTSGWGLGSQPAYPAHLEALLRAKGIDAQVINAGRSFDTTAGMLRRIEMDVPSGTQLVILQPGANDLRFLGTSEQRAANIAAIESRLRGRGISMVLFDPVFPSEYYGFDQIHFTAAAHAQIAQRLLPIVLDTLQHRGKTVLNPHLRAPRKPPSIERSPAIP